MTETSASLEVCGLMKANSTLSDTFHQDWCYDRRASEERYSRALNGSFDLAEEASRSIKIQPGVTF